MNLNFMRKTIFFQFPAKHRYTFCNLSTDTKAIRLVICKKRFECLTQVISKLRKAAGCAAIPLLRKVCKIPSFERLSCILHGKFLQSPFGDIIINIAVEKWIWIDIALRRNTRRSIGCKPIAKTKGTAAACTNADKHRTLGIHCASEVQFTQRERRDII